MHKEKEFAELFGLSDLEARLYLAGLNFDAASLTNLAKAAAVPRTAAYYPLKQLIDKGFVSSLRIGKRLHYRSLDTSGLARIMDERKRKLADLVTDLSPTIRAENGNFSVQYFPGVRGIEAAADLFLDSSKGKFWHTFEQPAHPHEKLGEQYFNNYIDRRVERKIHTKTIVPGTMRHHPWFKKHIENDAKELRETLVVSPEEYPVEATLVVDDERVLIFSAQSIPFATLIHNPHIAQSFISLHRIVWDRYKQ